MCDEFSCLHLGFVTLHATRYDPRQLFNLSQSCAILGGGDFTPRPHRGSRGRPPRPRPRPTHPGPSTQDAAPEVLRAESAVRCALLCVGKTKRQRFDVWAWSSVGPSTWQGRFPMVLDPQHLTPRLAGMCQHVDVSRGPGRPARTSLVALGARMGARAFRPRPAPRGCARAHGPRSLILRRGPKSRIVHHFNCPLPSTCCGTHWACRSCSPRGPRRDLEADTAPREAAVALGSSVPGPQCSMR